MAAVHPRNHIGEQTLQADRYFAGRQRIKSRHAVALFLEHQKTPIYQTAELYDDCRDGAMLIANSLPGRTPQ